LSDEPVNARFFGCFCGEVTTDFLALPNEPFFSLKRFLAF
jgi:hypothetical protein